MSDTYSDKLCQAIDVIVQKRLEELNPNRVVIGTIKEKRLGGQYLVESQFGEEIIAYSDNQGYVENDQIYVLKSSNINLIISKYLAQQQLSPSVNPEDQLIIYGQLNSSMEDIDQILPRIELKCQKMLIKCTGVIEDMTNIVIKINTNRYSVLIKKAIPFAFIDLAGKEITNINSLTVEGCSDWELFFGDSINSTNLSNTNNDLLFLKSFYKHEYGNYLNTKCFVTWLKFDSNRQYIKQTSVPFGEILQIQRLTNFYSNNILDDINWSVVETIDTIKLQKGFIVPLNSLAEQDLIRATLLARSSYSDFLSFQNLLYVEGTNYIESVAEKDDFYLFVQLSKNDEVIFDNTLMPCNNTEMEDTYKFNLYIYDTYKNISVHQITNEQSGLIECTALTLLSQRGENPLIEQNKIFNNLLLKVSSDISLMYGIFKLVVKYKGEVYIKYVPIGWKKDKNLSLTGPKEVKYNKYFTSPTYLQTDYAISGLADTYSLSNEFVYGSASQVPQLYGKSLIPSDIYNQDLLNSLYCIKVSVGSEIIFMQPIAIYSEQDLIQTQTELICNMQRIDLNLFSATDGSGTLIGKHGKYGEGIFIFFNFQLIGAISNNWLINPNPDSKLSWFTAFQYQDEDVPEYRIYRNKYNPDEPESFLQDSENESLLNQLALNIITRYNLTKDTQYTETTITLNDTEHTLTIIKDDILNQYHNTTPLLEITAPALIFSQKNGSIITEIQNGEAYYKGKPFSNYFK